MLVGAQVKAEFRGQAREFDATAPIEDVHAALVKFIKYPLSQQ